MFEKHKSSPNTPTPAAPAKKEAAVADYVIHSLPKEFYDRAAKLPLEDKSQVALAKPPAQLPPTTPLTPPRPPGAVQPARGTLLPMNRARGPVVVKPKVVAPPPPKKNFKKALIIVLSIVLIVGAIIAVLGYSLGWFSPPPPVVTPPVITPTPPPVVVTPPTPAPPKAVLGADTDSDGLTNIEEILYMTDFRNPDTDGDTFLDGNEVFHRYSPVGLAPATLLSIGAVRVLETVDLPFSMSYPTPWNPINQPAAKRVSFRSDTGAEVSVIWEGKDASLSLEDWFKTHIQEVEFEDLHATITKEGYPALLGPDERIMYIDGGANAYTLEYELGDSQSVEFLQTFKMMANSFKLSP